MHLVRPLHFILIVTACVLALPVARGESEISLSPEGDIIHEALPPAIGTGTSVPVFVYDPMKGGGQAREFQRDGLSFPAPSLSARTEDDEQRYSPDGLKSSAQGQQGLGPSKNSTTLDPRSGLGNEARPDRDTEKEGTIGYHASFDPSVVPFKRNRVLDTVGPEGHLKLQRSELEELTLVGSTPDPDRDVFWGTLLLQGTKGDIIPLPSVAAESRILSAEVSPKVPLTFYRDAADNLYVKPLFSSGEQETLRLVFLTDAPKRYFGSSIPKLSSLQDVPEPLRPRLPDAMQRSVDALLPMMKLDRKMPYAALLSRLVGYFRSFEAGSAPEDSGDLYRDLTRSKRGICRHRSYAFIVTAHGLGIPARYVFNEAHVFVEVWIPGSNSGWMRVDLGGNAERLVIEGAEDKVRHAPGGIDPFERPRAYTRGARNGPSAGASSVVGLPPTRREKRKLIESTAPERSGLLPPPAPLREAHPGALATSTTLSILAPVVYRGEAFNIEGTVLREDGSVPQGKVRLLLVSVNTGAALGLLETVALTQQGTYQSTLTIPSSQEPGAYELVAEYLGTPLSAPSKSR